MNLLLLSLLYFVYAVAEKPVLNILALVSKQHAKSGSRACQAAMNVVVKTANSRQDILPNYQVKVSFEEDGGQDGSDTIKQVKKFIDRADIETNNHNVFSPIVVGPSFGCKHSAMASRFQRIIHFPMACNSRDLVENRQTLYPNLYRIIAPAFEMYSSFFFAIKNIGKWKEISLLVSAGNQNLMENSFIVHQHLTNQGITVLNHLVEHDFYHAAAKINVKNTRIVMVIATSPKQCADFLCGAWSVGMRAPNFLFLSTTVCTYSTSIQLSEICSFETINEQLKITLIIGNNAQPLIDHGTTSLGYNLERFETEFRHELKGVVASDQARRFFCHDSMLATIITLNKTLSDSSINLNNFTFSNRDLLFNQANKAAAQLDIKGLRIGRIKYSPKIEVTGESMWITQLIDSKPKALYRLWRAIDVNNLNVSTYFELSLLQSEQFEEPTWMTKSHLPPKDFSKIDFVPANLNSTTAAELMTLVIVALFAKIILFILANVKNHKKAVNPIWKISSLQNTTTAIGCLLLDGGSITILANLFVFKVELCHCWNLLLLVGITIISMSSFARNATVKRMFPKMTIRVITGQSNFSISTATGSSTGTLQNYCNSINHLKSQSIFYKSISMSCCLTLIVYLIWSILLDPLGIEILKSEPKFDKETEQLLGTVTKVCRAQYSFYFYTTFFIVIAVFLSLAILFSCKNKPQYFKTYFQQEIIRLQRMPFISLTILIIVGLLLLTTSRSNNILLDLILVLGSFILSLFTFLNMYLTTISKKLATLI